MWSCFNKTCPCFRFRGNSLSPFGNFYDDEDNVEFENLLVYQDRSSLANLLSGAPFSRSNYPPAYTRRANMTVPNEDALLDDGENLQTQDAQFLPDEQIDKFSERVKCHPATDAQLAAEEEEARRQEEEEIERKREAATQAALAKGLITPEQASANSKNIFFTIEDEDDNDSREYTDSSRTMMHDSSSAESSTKSREATPHDDDSQISSLNKPRNPSERLFVQDVDYDDVTDYDDQSSPQLK